jgi:hypothetical protein
MTYVRPVLDCMCRIYFNKGHAGVDGEALGFPWPMHSALPACVFGRWAGATFLWLSAVFWYGSLAPPVWPGLAGGGHPLVCTADPLMGPL